MALICLPPCIMSLGPVFLLLITGFEKANVTLPFVLTMLNVNNRQRSLERNDVTRNTIRSEDSCVSKGLLWTGGVYVDTATRRPPRIAFTVLPFHNSAMTSGPRFYPTSTVPTVGSIIIRSVRFSFEKNILE